MGGPDIVVVSDPRFSGGTASALIADVLAFRAAGAHVGLLPVRSGFFAGTAEHANRQVLGLCDLDAVTLLGPGADIAAETVFFHHPLTFFHGVAERVGIRAETAVVVAHHPPFRGDGSLEYDPVRTGRRIAGAFGVTPLWAPVSGVIRRHLRSFAPLIRMTTRDWVNIFDEADWRPRRAAFAGVGGETRPTVGRHGRADPLKWPDAPEDVMASLHPAGGEWRTRVMGCPAPALSRAGADLAGWEILAFGQEPVDRFLDSLDVFSYAYSARWVEAFGRTVVEAMLMERPCVLDPRLRETFGDLAHYCPPHATPAVLERLRQDPRAARARAREVRRRVVARYCGDAVPRRLAELRNDAGTLSRRGAVLASPLVTLRKTVGLARRQRAGLARPPKG